MLIVGIAWIYVVLMMAVAEATSNQGTLMGAFFTLLFYGLLPLSIVLYVMNEPARRRARKAREGTPGVSAAIEPDGGDHAPGDAVAPERKEP
jgi:hypothetical protein